jgi:acyl carrier protein
MDDVAIDPSQSLVQYGASSLDLIEIVSASLRELSMRIPRTEFADLRTIDDFIELMWQYEQRGAPRAEATPEPGA